MSDLTHSMSGRANDWECMTRTRTIFTWPRVMISGYIDREAILEDIYFN